MVRIKNIKNQLPMEFMLPETDWTPPTSLPDWRGRDVAIDTENRDDGLAEDRGPGWATGAGWVAGFSVSCDEGSIYVPLRHPDTANFDHDQAGSWLRDLVRSPGKKFFFNGPYDLGWMWREFGIDPPDELEDAICQAFCLDENRLNYTLNSVAKWQEVPGKDEDALKQAADAFGLHAKKELWKLPARFVAPYGMQDSSSTLAMGRRMAPQLEAQGLMDAYRLEMDLVPMCLEMRKRGVRVNTDRAEQAMEKFYAKSRQALDQLGDYVQIGRRIEIGDIRSDKWMVSVFDSAGIKYPSTEKGNPSFSNEWMAREDAGPIPNLCARASKMYDAADKFVKEYILGFTHMGRIHATVNQYKGEEKGGTRTTRFSYEGPPLQQMPSRDDEIARDIRACFEPEPGDLWAAIDYSQQEFRLMVHFASVCHIVGIEKAVQMYNDDPDTDFHDMVVEITGLPRRRAKDVNFAKAFGAGPPKFALMTGMSLQEAKDAMAEYDDRLPWMRRLSEFCQKRVDARGYIRMLDGFRGRFDRWEPRWLDWNKVREKLEALRARGMPAPDMSPGSIESGRARTHDPDHPWYGAKLRRAFTHKALNTLIQGSAARQMKMAMRECWRMGIVPLLQMHDELDLSVRDRRTAELVQEAMRDVVKLVIPVKVDLEFGVNWGRAAKVERKGRDGKKEIVYGATWDEAQREMAA